MTEKFDLIHADPPWRYSDKSKNRGGAARHYDTLTIEQLKAMNVADYAAPDSYLFLWTTGPQLKVSIELLEAWGFKYSTLGFIWAKRDKNHWENAARRVRVLLRKALTASLLENPLKIFKVASLVNRVVKLITKELMTEAVKGFWFWGMGSHTRANGELVLIGTRGNPCKLRVDKGVHQILEDEIGEHSAKPEEVYKRLERLVSEDAKLLDIFTRMNRPRWKALGNQVDRTDYIICLETMKILPLELVDSSPDLKLLEVEHAHVV